MKKGVLKYITIFICLCASAFAINSPEIRCVTVLPSGEVIITWNIPADPLNEFQSYEIYYSVNQGGPYSNIYSVPVYNQPSFNTTGYNANNQRLFFYVQVKNNANVLSPPIDTVGTIFLSLTSATNAKVADFQWTNFHSPLPAGESTFYKVYREYPTNNWTMIGTVPVNTNGAIYYYHDTINVCHDSVNYRVELVDPIHPCSSVSNIKGDWYMDKTPPTPPRLDSVSVDVNGNVLIGIHPSYSPDSKCYRIYKWDASLMTFDSIATICPGNVPTVFTYTNSNANSASEEFSLASIDSCGNLGVIALNDQATIYTTATYDICSKSASLSWNPYKNMTGGVDHYEVLCSVNAGPMSHVADVTGTTYQHQNLVQGSTYFYRVRAHSILKNMALRDSITSTSNTFTVNTISANQPAFVYLSDVTVNNPAEDITVKWYIDNTVRVGGFNVYRSDYYNGPFSSVGIANYTAGSSSYSFSDNTAMADRQKYYYYVRVLDTCLLPSIKTDTSNSIFLTAATSGSFKVVLNWNDYSRWIGNVSSYNIYRSLDGVFSGGPIANVPFGTNTYTDDVSDLTQYSGKFIYYVEALEGTGNPYVTELSTSNYANAYIDALFFVPNAFVPKGHNKIFLPIGDYVEKSEYKLSIFDRWGTKIYETQDETAGWDGGQHTEGLFGYLIEYKNAMGEYRSQRGSVTLIR